MMCQPPNSPDLNVLDLGYFNALQAMQLKENIKTKEELVDAVHRTYSTMNIETLDNIFVTLQKFMESILSAEGTNQYKKPRVKKAKMKKCTVGQRVLECDQQAIKTAEDKLKQSKNNYCLL